MPDAVSIPDAAVEAAVEPISDFAVAMLNHSLPPITTGQCAHAVLSAASREIQCPAGHVLKHDDPVFYQPGGTRVRIDEVSHVAEWKSDPAVEPCPVCGGSGVLFVLIQREGE